MPLGKGERQRDSAPSLVLFRWSPKLSRLLSPAQVPFTSSISIWSGWEEAGFYLPEGTPAPGPIWILWGLQMMSTLAFLSLSFPVVGFLNKSLGRDKVEGVCWGCVCVRNVPGTGVDESPPVGEGQRVAGVRELHFADQPSPFLGPFFPE